MRALKLPVQVTRDHTLELHLPEDIEEGLVEVIVLVPEDGESLAGLTPEDASLGSGTLAEFLASTRNDHRFQRSKEDIDRHLHAERESWE